MAINRSTLLAKIRTSMYFKKFCLLIFSMLLLGMMIPFTVQAGDFEQAFIRLERHKITSQTGALVCATPATTGIENKVVISFPNSYTLNNTTSNWTVNTTNLPSGAAPWPGIGTATAVTSDAVTFPSNDLNVGINYCFNFAGENTLTNPNTAGYYSVQLSTQTAGSTTIDSEGIGVTISQNDQLQVSANTSINGTEIQNQLSSNRAEVVFQNEEIEYRITYGNRSAVPINIIIEASWNKGQFEDESSRIHDVADYQLNTASEGYNETPAIIDTQARKIMWVISNFPANTTDQVVSFKLRTRSDYKGDKKINFTTSSRILEDNIVTPYSSIYHEYRYGLNPSSPGPATTTTAQPPTTTPQSSDLAAQIGFQSVEIIEVSNTGFIGKVLLTNSAGLVIRYGTNPTKLNNILRVPQIARNQLFELKDLNPNSNHYFTIQATDPSGRSAASDIFFVKTSTQAVKENAIIENLVISSNSNILYGGEVLSEKITLAKNSLVEFNFKLLGVDIKQIHVYIQPKNLASSKILGIISSVDANEVGSQTILSELTLGSFFGRLRTPLDLGQYNVVARIADYAGNIFEKSLFEMQAVKPITILSKEKAKPVEGARVYFYAFSEREKIYNMLSSQSLHLNNPTHTDNNGEVLINLPQGRYRIEVNAIGFKDQSIDFEIGPGGSTGYPEVYLEKDPEIIMNTINYYKRSAKDLLDYVSDVLLNISTSTRLFDLFSLGILSTLVLATWLAFLVKLRISLFHLPHLVLHSILAFINRGVRKHTISGLVYNVNQSNPVYNYEIILQNKNGVVLEEKKIEQKNGTFTFDKLVPGSYKLEIIKEHFPLKRLKVEVFADKDLEIDLGENPVPKLHNRIKLILLELTGISFEALMIISIIIEILFIYSFGLWKVLPFLLLSIINLVIFVQFIRTSKL